VTAHDTNQRQVAAIDAWLPQTQCTQCGYPRCLDYARALASGEAGINQCPPGGQATIDGLARLLGRPTQVLNPAFGEHRPRTVARIDEPRCIGCTLCIQACPVDAIVGAGKRMHTVIAAECTGCELCLPPCPVDCIELLPAPRPEPAADGPWPDHAPRQVDRARRRARAREQRLRRRADRQRLVARHREARGPGRRERMQRDIADAVSRVRARRASGPASGNE